jgi:hypothetical protein
VLILCVASKLRFYEIRRISVSFPSVDVNVHVPDVEEGHITSVPSRHVVMTEYSLETQRMDRGARTPFRGGTVRRVSSSSSSPAVFRWL